MLTEEQKAEVAKWFAAGASLDEIQKRMKAEFGVHMTYLDVRLMVAELPQPVEAEPAAPDGPAHEGLAHDGLAHDGPAREVPAPPRRVASSSGPASDEGTSAAPKRYDLDAPDADEGKPSPDVVVEMDTLTIPGTYASGDVTFSDGTKAKWYLDQQGRLGLGNAPEGYRPSQSDAALFQARLVEALRARGLA
ncbi:MAG: hypothetical protein ACI4UY_09215 [Kiritimatiellia bacterium]